MENNETDLNQSKQNSNIYLSPFKKKASTDSNLPNPKVYQQLKESMASGMFEATDEDVEKMVLIPHFDPPDLDFTGEQDVSVQPSKKKIEKPKEMSAKVFYTVQSKARSKAEKIYDNRMKKYYDRMKRSTQDIDPDKLNSGINSFYFREDQKDKLIESLTSLKKQVQVIQQQNAALSQHLLLLSKAKKQLETHVESTKSSTEWGRQQVKKYHEQKEKHKKHGFSFN